METRKPYETITLHDPAIDWDAVKNPPLVERECSACAGANLATCSECNGSGVVTLPAYEPYNEGAFCRERDLSKVLPRTFPGMAPTIYVYRRLTREQRQKFTSLGTSYEDRCIRAFQAGVIEIRRAGAPSYRPTWLGRAALAMDEKELKALEENHGLDTLDMLDIGSQILARSDVPLDCSPDFPVLPSSADAWAAVQRRSAARNRSGAHPTSDGPKGP